MADTPSPNNPSAPGPPVPPENRLRVTLATAVVAGTFCLLVSAVLLVEHFRASPIDVLQAPEIQGPKEKLRLAPNNEQLKEQIRQLDLSSRQRFFHQLSLTRSGGWLLLTGWVVFLLATKQAAALRRRLPMPAPRLEPSSGEARSLALTRRSVALVALVVTAAFFSLILSVGTSLPSREADLKKLVGGDQPSPTGGALSDVPSLTEVQANWPQFRGPSGAGVSTQTNVPLTWDFKTGAGLVWKTAVPSSGFNSPVVWGNRVFLSSGDKSKREVFCFDAGSGQILWQRAVENVPGSSAQIPEIPPQTGVAAATMATDGRRVYAFFANGDLAAFTFDGTLVWAKSFGPLKNAYGHASSLAIWQCRLILQLDQGETEDRKSKIYAFDGATGQILWQKPRPVPSSWASPIVLDMAGKQQIITLALPWVISHAMTDGTELWRAEGLAGEVTPSPIFAGGLVMVLSPSEKLMAIKPDGQGDITKSHIAWTAEDNIPDVTSPVSNGELVWTITTMGVLTCFDARTGKKQWEHDLGVEFQASPTLVGNRVYLIGLKGVNVVVEAAREFKQLARTEAETDEKFLASPAFAQNRMFIRGTKNLYCIGGAVAPLAKGTP